MTSKCWAPNPASASRAASSTSPSTRTACSMKRVIVLILVIALVMVFMVPLAFAGDGPGAGCQAWGQSIAEGGQTGDKGQNIKAFIDGGGSMKWLVGAFRDFFCG